MYSLAGFLWGFCGFLGKILKKSCRGSGCQFHNYQNPCSVLDVSGRAGILILEGWGWINFNTPWRRELKGARTRAIATCKWAWSAVFEQRLLNLHPRGCGQWALGRGSISIVGSCCFLLSLCVRRGKQSWICWNQVSEAGGKKGNQFFVQKWSGQPRKKGNLIYGRKCCCFCMLTMLEARRFQKRGYWSVKLANGGEGCEVDFRFCWFLAAPSLYLLEFTAWVWRNCIYTRLLADVHQ